MNPYRPGPSRSRGLADRMERRPLTARLVLMVVAFLLLIPIAGIIRGSGTNVVRSGGLPGAAVGADPLLSATTAAAAATSASSSAPSGSPSSAAATFVPASSPASTSASAAAVASGDLTAASTAAPSTAAKKTATTPATTAARKTATTPATTAAKKAPATTAATKSTSPPSTKAPVTTAAAPPKPQATTTTTAEAAPAPPANTYSKADVEAIIRSIWPPDQADQAVRIAKRESNLVPTVRNWCCYGLFQIYFKMNQRTLAAVGVTSPEQLYDPRVNAEAAYAIYQRSGWAPWGQ